MRKFLYAAVVAGFALVALAQLQQNLVPANFRTTVANADPAKKADILAWGVLAVQGEAVAVQGDVTKLRGQTDQGFKQVQLSVQQADQAINKDAQLIGGLQKFSSDHETRIKTLEQNTSSIVQHIQATDAQNLKAQLDALQKQLTQFRSAACPALKNSKLKDAEKTEVEKVCQTEAPSSN